MKKFFTPVKNLSCRTGNVFFQNKLPKPWGFGNLFQWGFYDLLYVQNLHYGYLKLSSELTKHTGNVCRSIGKVLDWISSAESTLFASQDDQNISISNREWGQVNLEVGKRVKFRIFTSTYNDQFWLYHNVVNKFLVYFELKKHFRTLAEHTEENFRFLVDLILLHGVKQGPSRNFYIFRSWG